MEKLVIDREQWYRGRAKGSLLRRVDGKMCCLGFDCLRRGLTAEEITCIGTPEELSYRPDLAVKLVGLVDVVTDVFSDEGERSLFSDNEVTLDLVNTNDDPGLAEEEREATIIQLFAEIGVAVEFIN